MHLQVLLENGANVDAISETGESPLHIASQFGHLPLVEVQRESNDPSVTMMSLDFG